MRKHVLTAVVSVVALIVGGVAAWHYLVLQPVETGQTLTCGDCQTVISSQIRVVRVPFWHRDKYHVEHETGLCQACAERPVLATAQQATYCRTCRGLLKTETVSATVPRASYDEWTNRHQAAWSQCGRCQSAELVRTGLGYQEQGKYAEAETCYIGASSADPTNTDAQRFLTSVRSVHAEDLTRARRLANPAPLANAGGGGDCPTCHGSGIDPLRAICPVCRGNGHRFVIHRVGILGAIFGGEETAGDEECDNCKGTGKTPCPDCHGAGEAWMLSRPGP